MLRLRQTSLMQTRSVTIFVLVIGDIVRDLRNSFIDRRIVADSGFCFYFSHSNKNHPQGYKIVSCSNVDLKSKRSMIDQLPIGEKETKIIRQNMPETLFSLFFFFRARLSL